MKMISGFLPPDAGTAVVCGHDITREPIAAKKRIGYLPEGAPAYPDMTAAEFLGFIARIRGFARGAIELLLDPVSRPAGLDRFRRINCGYLAHSVRQFLSASVFQLLVFSA